MPTPPALCHDTFYHIFNRGVNREDIFPEERNYSYFLNLYAQHIEPAAETFAYCLMPNHFHLLVRTRSEEEIKPADLSNQFSKFFNAYAKAINKACGRTGSLFQHPFGRVPILDSNQFAWAVVYIHHNPQKHQLIRDYRNWKYSSYRSLLSLQATRLERDLVLDWIGGREQFLANHEVWPVGMEEEPDEP